MIKRGILSYSIYLYFRFGCRHDDATLTHCVSEITLELVLQHPDSRLLIFTIVRCGTTINKIVANQHRCNIPFGAHATVIVDRLNQEY
jgi:hypothetical protein